MNDDNKFTKVSMFLDGELSNAEMNNVEKIIDKDDDVKEFILNNVKARAYSNFYFKNETTHDEIVLPFNKKQLSMKFFLRAASIILLIGVGMLMSNIVYDRSDSNLVFADNFINPVYQNVLSTALENYKSNEPYKASIPEMEMHVIVIPEKTYKDNNGTYIRKFVIKYNLGDKTIGINGFAQRKNKESWEIKTLVF